MNNIKPFEVPQRRFPVDVTSSMPEQFRGSSSDIAKADIGPPREERPLADRTKEKKKARPS